MRVKYPTLEAVFDHLSRRGIYGPLRKLAKAQSPDTMAVILFDIILYVGMKTSFDVAALDRELDELRRSEGYDALRSMAQAALQRP